MKTIYLVLWHHKFGTDALAFEFKADADKEKAEIELEPDFDQANDFVEVLATALEESKT